MNNKNQHIPQGYKSSPLGIIPEDWEVKRLGDVCDNNGDYGLNAPATDFSVNLPTYIRITDIDDNGKFIHSDKKSVNSPDVNAYYLKDGDIVFARTGATVGKTYLYDKKDGELVYAGFLIKFSPNTNAIHPYYLKANTETQNYKNWVMITSQRSGQPGINAAEYCSFKFPVPPLPEQQRIVSVLQLWDTAIEKQTQLIEKLSLRKRALMKQLLTGKKRLKGFEGEWKEVKLGEIGTFFKGNGVPKNKIIGVGHKCLTYGDLYTKYNFVISNVKSFIDDETVLISTEIKYGDICFAGSGETKEDIGKCAAFIDDQIGYAGGDIIVFRANDFNPITLSYILNSENVIKQKSNMGQGHSVVHIYPYQLEKLTFTMPTRKEQNAIASVLIQADKGIELANKKLSQLQEQKKGLMQVLLTGKRRVK